MNGFGLSRERFALLFSVMLVAAAGNTAMQSLLPAIGRELGVADIWVAVAFCCRRWSGWRWRRSGRTAPTAAAGAR